MNMINPDFDKLIGAVVPIAQNIIRDLGTFIPFGAFITKDGELQLAGGEGDATRFDPQQILDMYLDAYREAAAAESFVSTVLCVDVRVQLPGEIEKTDAIRMMLEHCEGEALDAFMPYKKDANSEVVYGRMFAQSAEPKVFIKLVSENEQ